MKAQAGSDCEIIRTEGQANAIIKVAKSRKIES